MKIAHNVGVVTGAGGGIGAALTRRLVENGASVVATDLHADRLAAEVDAIAADHPGRVVALAGDCADADHITATVALAEATFGAPVGFYAANAGVPGGRSLGTADEWALSLEVNVLAHVRAAEILLPGWLERGEGYFLSTASAAGLLTQIGSATYSVSKHAAVAFVEWLSVTYGSRGIGVSCLCPMGVRTAMLTGGIESDDELDNVGAKAVTEAGNVLEPLEVADIVLAGLEAEQFLILPHPQVLDFYRRKGSDYDRWLRGMRRYQDSLS